MKNRRKLLGIAIFVVAMMLANCSDGDGGGGDDDPPLVMFMEYIPPTISNDYPYNLTSFTMGSSNTADNNAQPPHQVTLTEGFFMGWYEVTQEQYKAVMGELPDMLLQIGGNLLGDRLPVVFVSWYDALVFCNKASIKKGLRPAYTILGETNPDKWPIYPYPNTYLAWDTVTIVPGSDGYRLPTEAQWEYACRAGSTTAWSFGDTDVNIDLYAWTQENSGVKTHEVGKKLPNAFGLYDMHGNVWEWVWDRYGVYSSEAQINPTGATSGEYRIVRGGCAEWGSAYSRSALRYSTTFNGYTFYGFRVVCP